MFEYIDTSDTAENWFRYGQVVGIELKIAEDKQSARVSYTVDGKPLGGFTISNLKQPLRIHPAVELGIASVAVR